MTLPKVSVILNTFREKPGWLYTAIQSYRVQRDVTVQIIASCVEGDENIGMIKSMGCEIVLNEEAGIYQQINSAIPYITGDWACYASGNDMACDTKFKDEINHCVAPDQMVCYSNFYKCDVNLRVKSTYQGRPYDYNDHLKGNYVSDCALVRSDVLKKYAPFRTEWKNHAFYDLWLRIYEGEGDVFVYNPNPTWFYRFHEGSKLKRKNNLKLQNENREIRERMLLWHRDRFGVLVNAKTDDIIMKRNADALPDAVNNATNADETHFVYVYVSSPARWNELAISIQSIRKHFQGKAKFFCVGDPPGIKDVIHIPVVQVKGRGCKPKDAVVKLKAIANCPLINEDFVYCYDDIILLRDITPEWFDKVVAVEHVNDYMTHWNAAKGVIPDQGWRSLFMKTFAVLTKKHLTTFNYETHIPRKMCKSKILQTMDRFGETVCGDALFSSLYFNQHNAKPDILLKENNRIKAGLHRAYDNPAKIIEEIKGRTFLNYSDPALNEKFKKIINQIMKGEIKL